MTIEPETQAQTADIRIATGDIEARVLDVCEPILADLGYVCVHLAFLGSRGARGRGVLRFYIDTIENAARTENTVEPPKEGEGVTLTDCVKASRQLDTALDVEDVVPGSYTLEVSSPGLDRPLGRLSDFARFEGQQATLKTIEPIDGRRNFTGTLAGVRDEMVLLVVEGNTVEVPTQDIRKANLKYPFEAESK